MRLNRVDSPECQTEVHTEIEEGPPQVLQFEEKKRSPDYEFSLPGHPGAYLVILQELWQAHGIVVLGVNNERLHLQYVQFKVWNQKLTYIHTNAITTLSVVALKNVPEVIPLRMMCHCCHGDQVTLQWCIIGSPKSVWLTSKLPGALHISLLFSLYTLLKIAMAFSVLPV